MKKADTAEKNKGKASAFPTVFERTAGYTVGTDLQEGNDEFNGIEAVQRVFAVWNCDGNCHRIADRIIPAIEKFFRAEVRHGFFLDKMNNYARINCNFITLSRVAEGPAR